MIEDAKSEKNESALRSLVFANETEKAHAEFYKKVLDALGTNLAVDYYVCTACGNTSEGGPPDVCSICQAPKKSFKKIA